MHALLKCLKLLRRRGSHLQHLGCHERVAFFLELVGELGTQTQPLDVDQGVLHQRIELLRDPPVAPRAEVNAVEAEELVALVRLQVRPQVDVVVRRVRLLHRPPHGRVALREQPPPLRVSGLEVSPRRQRVDPHPLAAPHKLLRDRNEVPRRGLRVGTGVVDAQVDDDRLAVAVPRALPEGLLEEVLALSAPELRPRQRLGLRVARGQPLLRRAADVVGRVHPPLKAHVLVCPDLLLQVLRHAGRLRGDDVVSESERALVADDEHLSPEPAGAEQLVGPHEVVQHNPESVQNRPDRHVVRPKDIPVAALRCRLGPAPSHSSDALPCYQ
eukprot:Rhum_TRINITY_DN18679_c0_g1::Rhum_TRINITY_DN18679_c0_g1_i1::g.167798::m.167798